MLKEFLYSNRIKHQFENRPNCQEAVGILRTILRGSKYESVNLLAAEYCMQSMETSEDVAAVMEALFANYYDGYYDFYISLLKTMDLRYLDDIEIVNVSNLDEAVALCGILPRAVLPENTKYLDEDYSNLDLEAATLARKYITDELENVDDFIGLIGIISRIAGLDIPTSRLDKSQFMSRYVFDHVLEKAYKIIDSFDEMSTIISIIMNSSVYSDSAKKRLLEKYFDLGLAQLGEKPSYVELIKLYEKTLVGSEIETMIIELINRKSEDLTSIHVPIKKVRYFYETAPSKSILKQMALNRIMDYIDKLLT